MLKSLFDLPKTEAAFQIHDHSYWIRHHNNWWRASWILKYGERFSVMYQTSPGGGDRFAGYVDTLSDAEALMKKMGRKAKSHG